MAKTLTIICYFVALLSLFAAIGFANAQLLEKAPAVAANLKPRQASTTSSRTASATPTNTYTPVVGAGSCVNRLKIENLQSSQPDTFNLFVLAMRRLMDAASTDDLSWYQLSGIHGAPFIPWQQPASGQYDRSIGYCTHHSVIFGTWHRPYLILLEQALARTALSIAQDFTGDARTQYVAAAAQLRLPYWDWADPDTQSRLPTVCMSSTIQVKAPNSVGSPVATTISNPLYAYNFKGTESSTFPRPFNTWPRTARQPDSSGNTRESVASNTMQSGFTTRRRATYNSFARSSSFNAFSNAIENVHDDVHGSVGGNRGHMTFVPYSAFDPIFWLHHTNIDRMFAMYQAANPGFLLASGDAVPTFARPAAVIDDINTPLIPFRKPDMSWWTSVHASYANKTWSNGYGYPEVPCSYQVESAAALDSYTTTQINALYRPSTALKLKRDEGTKYVEWDAKIVLDQSELPGSYFIYIFLGEPEADYNLWQISENEVGSLASVGFPERRKKAMIRSATVPISPILEDRGIKLGVDEMSEYLERELTWVVLNNGFPVDVKTLKSLKIAVTATEVTIPGRSDRLPIWGKPTYYLNISSKKDGGAKRISDVENPTLLDGKKGKPATGLQL